MFLRPRLLSARSWPAFSPRAGTLVAALTFVLGLAIGAAIGPVSASRGSPAATVVTPERANLPAQVRAALPVEVLHVLDGDTFEARVHLWPGLNITTRVRLRGIDAPELKARCVEERVKAEAAHAALRAMLAQGQVGITAVTLDKYARRVLAEASTFSTANVAAELLNAGYVRPYAGARREPWCP